jgi:hypothetical protein
MKSQTAIVKRFSEAAFSCFRCFLNLYVFVTIFDFL